MELWDARDLHGNKTGETLVRGEEVPAGRWHLGVHIWYINAKGELLVQRRSLRKKAAPGLWACSGGSALRGETSEMALVRESEEELGITPDVSRSVRFLSYMSEDCITDVYIVPWEGDAAPLRLQEEEVMDAKWISQEEMRSLIGRETVFWQYRYLELLLRFLRDEYSRVFPVE